MSELSHKSMISEKSVKLFKRASKEIPGYRDFLSQQGFDFTVPIDISTFERIPITSKKEYLQTKNLRDLVWKKDLEGIMLLCSTSGSTGDPYYFPRNDRLSWQYSYIIEDYLNNGPKGSTLVLLGFGMGVWIGGVITLRAFEIAGARLKSSVTVLPTGYNKTEIFKALAKLSPGFDQTVIVGYPPFVKELLDDAPKHGVDLRKLKIRFLFAAEAFTETFRDYLCRKANVRNPLRDTLNIYGTADIGAMAYETPISILIRRMASKNRALFRSIFGQISKTPTLTQYNPEFIEFECLNEQIILTGDAALPLIRYAVGDHGGVISFQQMKKVFVKHGLNLNDEINKAGIKDTVKELPFVFVYERIDFSVTLHGINIYPEFIKEGLLDPALSPYLTERFTMLTKYDRRQNQFLEINLELQEGVKPGRKLRRITPKIITDKLIEKSSEFAEISKDKHSKRIIKLNFLNKGNPKYFAPGTKQKWVEKVQVLYNKR